MPLKQVQKDAVKFCVNRRRALIRMPTGSGKTLTTTTLMNLLKTKGLIKRTFIFMKTKEMAAYKKPFNNPYGLTFLFITSSKEMDAFRKGQCGVFDAYVFSLSLLDKYKDFLVSIVPKADLVVIEEVHNARVSSSKTTRALRAISWKYHGRMIALTATPCHTELENLYSIFSILEPSLFKSWDWFFENFVVYKEKKIRAFGKVATGAGVNKMANFRVIKERIGYKNEERLLSLLEPYMFYSDDTKFTVNFSLKTYSLLSETGDRYNTAIQGIGLDKVFRIGLAFPDGTEKMVQRMKTENFWTISGGQISPALLTRGSWVRINSQNCQVTFVKDSDSLGDYLKRLLAVQRITSDSLEKKEALLSILPETGRLVYFQFKDSLASVQAYLKKMLPNRKTVVLTGDVTNFNDKMKALKSNDIVLMTRVATQSLDFYFQDAIVYECLPTPGILEQFVGRITRENADFTEVNVSFILGSGTVENYFYERTRFMTNSVPNAQYKNKLPSTNSFAKLANDSGITISDMKSHLLWAKV